MGIIKEIKAIEKKMERKERERTLEDMLWENKENAIAVNETTGTIMLLAETEQGLRSVYMECSKNDIPRNEDGSIDYDEIFCGQYSPYEEALEELAEEIWPDK